MLPCHCQIWRAYFNFCLSCIIRVLSRFPFIFPIPPHTPLLYPTQQFDLFRKRWREICFSFCVILSFIFIDLITKNDHLVTIGLSFKDNWGTKYLFMVLLVWLHLLDWFTIVLFFIQWNIGLVSWTDHQLIVLFGDRGIYFVSVHLDITVTSLSWPFELHQKQAEASRQS